MEQINKLTAIIDADSIAYIVAYHHLDTDIDNPQAVVIQTNEFIGRILTAVNADNYIGYIGNTGYTFRHKASMNDMFGTIPEKIYKGQRGVKGPEWYGKWESIIKAQLLHKWGFKVVPNKIEADDAVAMVAKKCRSLNQDYIICSNDKDLYQIPGKHYNYKSEKMLTISSTDADFNKYKQLLMGDSTDNITGIPKIGEKTAEKILSNLSNLTTMKYVVLREYINYYGERRGIVEFAYNTNLIFMVDDPNEVGLTIEDVEYLFGNVVEIKKDLIKY